MLHDLGINRHHRVVAARALTLLFGPVAGNGRQWLCCIWPKESKVVKIPLFKYARAKFSDRPGARDVRRVGDPGRARIEPKRRVKWRK